LCGDPILKGAGGKGIRTTSEFKIYGEKTFPEKGEESAAENRRKRLQI